MNRSTNKKQELKCEVVELCSSPHNGNVMDLFFYSSSQHDYIFVASSNGSIYSYEVTQTINPDTNNPTFELTKMVS